MHSGKVVEAHWVKKGRLSCDSEVPQVGSARSEWTRVVNVNYLKTICHKTRLYCILVKKKSITMNFLTKNMPTSCRPYYPDYWSCSCFRTFDTLHIFLILCLWHLCVNIIFITETCRALKFCIIFGPKKDEMKVEWRKLHNEELHNLYLSPSVVRVIKSRRMRWAGYVARMGERRGVYRVLVGKREGKRPFRRQRLR